MPDDVAVSIVEMQALLLGTETIQEFLAEMAALAVLTVGDGLSCGITLQTNGRPLTVAATDALAAQVDEVQYGLDQGPCLHALRTGTLVSIEDLASDQRWAAYAATPFSTESGPRCRSAQQRQPHHRRVQPVSQVTGSGSGRRRPAAPSVSRTTPVGALSIAVRLADHVALTDQLRASLDSRAVIDQAIGVLMGQRRITAADAFAILRTTSQNRNIKLRAFAAQSSRAPARPPQPPPSTRPLTRPRRTRAQNVPN